MSDVHHNSQPSLPLPGLLAAAKDAMVAELHGRLAGLGYGDIRDSHGCVFRFVREDGLRLTELAARAGITKQSAGEIVDDLERRGYVERAPDPDDRRAKIILLTERGRQAQAAASHIFAETEERWAERFGAEQMALLRATLEAVVASEVPQAVAGLGAVPA